MLEIYCRSGIHQKCRDITGDRPLCWIKGQEPPKWEYEGFYEGSSAYGIIWHFEGLRTHNKSFSHGCALFSTKAVKLADAWIREKYDNDWVKAIKSYKCFDEFEDAFEAWFIERKNKFMDKTAEIIRQLNPDLKRIKPLKTNSHGGVANLLKVLTKTMHEQGATIRTIAKTQYVICLQAGIYIPEEFITDVLVAEDIDPTIYEGEKKDD